MFSLRNLIGSRAVISGVLNEVNTEIISENNLISEITSINHNFQQDAFYAVIFVASVYLQYQYFIQFDKKLQDVKMFSDVKRKTKSIILIFMLVFTKNIQDAM